MLRATLVPMLPISLPRVHNNTFICRPPQQMDASLKCPNFNTNPFKALLPVYKPGSWRPILRGTQGKFKNNGIVLLEEITCDGVIDYLFLDKYVEHDLIITPNWITAFIGNALCTAERFRKTANAPEVEYGLEFEISVAKEPIPIADYVSNNRFWGDFSHGSTQFPRYSVGSPNTFSDILTFIDQDF